jgi:hypothetical protein
LEAPLPDDEFPSEFVDVPHAANIARAATADTVSSVHDRAFLLCICIPPM